MLLVASHSERCGADDLADVFAVLGLRMHPAADEFEFGMFKHTFDRRDTDRPGCPLNDPQAHEHVLHHRRRRPFGCAALTRPHLDQTCR